MTFDVGVVIVVGNDVYTSLLGPLLLIDVYGGIVTLRGLEERSLTTFAI